VTGGEAASHIGVGAILGAPFMLSTLAMFVTGIAVLALRRRRSTGDRMPVDTGVLAHDMRYFAIAYAIAIAAAFLPAEPHWTRWIVAAGLLGIYAYYVREHFQAEAGGGDPELAPLRMHRLDRRAPAHLTAPRLRIVIVQVLVALGCIIGGAYAFVGAIEDLATSLGVDGTLLALVIAPIATELPEKANSVLWVRLGKDTLAMGNITGAMVFQSAIPTSIGLLFATEQWSVTSGSAVPFLSAGIAFLSSAAIFLPMARRSRLHGQHLLVGGAFYVLYIALVVAAIAGVIG
jgi:cation:H+ antiporter